MMAVDGSRWRHALFGACLTLTVAAHASAQQTAPIPDPPATPEFLSRYDFHLEMSYLGSGDDTQFMWDTHWGGEVDLADYVSGRVTLLADYEAVLGNQWQPFDPNQGIYTLEGSASKRFGRTEMAGVFHHVSRHLSDRAKDFGIAVNVAGGRLLRRFDRDQWTVDFRADAGKVVSESSLDYSWTSGVDVTARHPINERIGGYGRAFVEFYGIDSDKSDRDTQRGGRVEAGLRLRGRAGAIDLFAGWERVIDADPLERRTRGWPVAGFRLVN